MFTNKPLQIYYLASTSIIKNILHRTISSVLFWVMNNVLLHLSEVAEANNDFTSYFSNKLDCLWNTSGCPNNSVIYHAPQR